MVRRHWRRVELFERMSELLGARTDRGTHLDRGDDIRAARRRCRDCQYTDDCRNWLDSEALPLPPDICPNRDFFSRCGPRPFDDGNN
ncbi:MAG: hypothetical protein KKB37_00175 [Alphaproteobacteria bacterium]|nr:hypothetical protein [Alphaproteobacteria bacterium]